MTKADSIVEDARRLPEMLARLAKLDEQASEMPKGSTERRAIEQRMKMASAEIDAVQDAIMAQPVQTLADAAVHLMLACHLSEDVVDLTSIGDKAMAKKQREKLRRLLRGGLATVAATAKLDLSAVGADEYTIPGMIPAPRAPVAVAA